MNIETIRRWADRGLLPCLRTPMNHRRFRAEDVDAVYRPDPASADTVSVA